MSGSSLPLFLFGGQRGILSSPLEIVLIAQHVVDQDLGSRTKVAVDMGRSQAVRFGMSLPSRCLLWIFADR